MHRLLIGVAALLAACQPAPPRSPSWPDRSHVLEQARQVGSQGRTPEAAEVRPEALHIGYAQGGREDHLLSAWYAGVAGTHDHAPRLFALTGPESGDVVPILPNHPEASRGRRLGAGGGERATGRTVLKRIVRHDFDCGRAGAATFLEGALKDAPVVALARVPARNPDRARMVLRRRPGLEEESLTEMKKHTFVVWEHDSFFRASAAQWLRGVGLAALVPRLSVRPSGESLTAYFEAGKADYAFVVKGRRKDSDGARHGTVVDLKPEAFAAPELAQNLLVCRTDVVATHRRDLIELIARWREKHPESAPQAVDEENLEVLMGLLRSAGVVSATAPTHTLVDGALLREAEAL